MATFKEKKRKEKTSGVPAATKTFADLQSQLLDAVVQCKAKVVKRLLDQRIDPNCKNDLGETPLIIACQLENNEMRRVIASLLMKREANVNIQDISGNSAISNAVKSSDEVLVETLIDKGADISQTTSEGNSLLCCAAMSGNVEVTKIILREVLKQKIPVDHKNMHGLTPLLLAAQGGHIDIARVLVTTGKASVTIRDLDNFMTAEQWMKQCGYTSQELTFLSPKSRHKRKNVKSLLESAIESESSPNIYSMHSNKMEDQQKPSSLSLPHILSPTAVKRSDDATRSMFQLPSLGSTASYKHNPAVHFRAIEDLKFKSEQLPHTAVNKRDIFASSYLNKRKSIVDRSKKSKFFAKGSLEPLHTDDMPLPLPTLKRMNSISESEKEEGKHQDYSNKEQTTKLPPLQ